MLLITLIGVLFFFSIMGMEIAWAIGLAGFAYLTLSQFTTAPRPWFFLRSR